MPRRRGHSWGEIALVVGAPLVLAIVELIHPQPHNLLKLDVRTWLAVHYAQIALFPLTALAMSWWVRGETGFAAAVCRLALFVFAVTWTAWDAVAGVATGILIQAAHDVAPPVAWIEPINAIWMHPIMGGAGAPVFAVVGSLALSIGAIAAGRVLRRAGHGWGPVLTLVIASFGLAIFRTHAWPGGPFTFGGISIASVWLMWERAGAAWRSPFHATSSWEY